MLLSLAFTGTAGFSPSLYSTPVQAPVAAQQIAMKASEAHGARNARIVGVGASAPKKRVSNVELEEVVETSDEWIAQRTGELTSSSPNDQSASALRPLLK